MGTHPIFESDFDCLTDSKMPSTEFNLAADQARSLTQPTNEEKLEVYALYKQCMVGDCNIGKPGMTDVKGKAKWEAWNGKKGMSQADADAAYVKIVAELKAKYC